MTNVRTFSQCFPDAAAMMAAAASSTSPPPCSRHRLPEAWVERLFARLSALYGARLADLWRGADLEEVKDVWAVELADLSGEEIARGLAACRERKFPPTLPEFRELCRPPIDFEAAYREAVEQMRLREQGLDRWSSPAIYWAAARIGSWDLRNSSYAAIAKRWQAELAKALEEQRAGNLPDIPPARPTLPAPGQTTPPAQAKAWMTVCRAILEGRPKPEIEALKAAARRASAAAGATTCAASHAARV